MGYRIGKRTHIFMGVKFDCPGNLSIDSNSVINQDCRLDSRGAITIGKNVSISADVAILTADHDPQSPEFLGRIRPVTIEDYVFIGTRAMILPGVRIGKAGVVGAGAIVTKDVEPYSIVAGMPARPIGERNRELAYTIDHGGWFS